MKKENLLSIKDLTKQYSKNQINFRSIFLNKNKNLFFALKDINFDINKGEKLAFLGKNGSGKSTLLKIISRITLPTSGEVIVKGKIISMLESGFGFSPDLTARENIHINSSILGADKNEIKQILPLIFEFAQLNEFIDVPVKRFSTGMEARLGFSMGIYLPSDILLLDELLATIDGKFREKCINKLASDDFNKTLIFVSHNLDLVSRICNRGVVLNNGKMVYDGNISSSIEKYKEFM